MTAASTSGRSTRTCADAGPRSATARTTAIDRPRWSAVHAHRLRQRRAARGSVRRRLHYCHDLGHWLTWTGSRWRVDPRRRRGDAPGQAHGARHLRRGGRREQRRRAQGDRKWAAQSEADSRIRAMLHLARTEPGIPVAADELDADPWLLNVRNGTIDLRTGEAARRIDLRICAPAWRRSTTTPRRARTCGSGSSPTSPVSTHRRGVRRLPGPRGGLLPHRLDGRGGAAVRARTQRHGQVHADRGRDQDARALRRHRRLRDVRRPARGGANNDVARLAGARLVSSVEVDDGRRWPRGW